MTENNIPKITYLFGAGASAQALPTIKKLPERIKIVRDFVDRKCVYDENEVFNPTTEYTFKKNDAKQYVLDGLDKLFVQSSSHSTIDTYAKKLNISGNSQEINELTFFLALYFNIEQKISGLDPRYDTFLVSLLNYSSYSFPDNLKFLSWNYDLQMEAAHEKIANKDSHELAFYLFSGQRNDLSKEKFTSSKLNGSSNLVSGEYRHSLPLIKNILKDGFSKEDLDFPLSYAFLHVKQRLQFYNARINLKFAWYNDGEFINKIVNNYNETEILVVVGYSFPFFNREVDRKIIRAMTKLRKIYIQDCVPENIKSRFLSILPDWKERKIELISVNDVSEFFLPPEL